jgi:hypothetical protein
LSSAAAAEERSDEDDVGCNEWLGVTPAIGTSEPSDGTAAAGERSSVRSAGPAACDAEVLRFWLATERNEVDLQNAAALMEALRATEPSADPDGCAGTAAGEAAKRPIKHARVMAILRLAQRLTAVLPCMP